MQVDAFVCGDNIIVMEMMYGFLCGEYKIYDAYTFELKKSQHYISDKRHGTFRTYSNGTIKKEETYNMDVLNGPVSVFYSNGIQSSRAFYINGNLSGQRQVWRPDGTLWKLERWRGGKVGRIFEFSRDGSIVKDGVLVKPLFQFEEREDEEEKECDYIEL